MNEDILNIINELEKLNFKHVQVTFSKNRELKGNYFDILTRAFHEKFGICESVCQVLELNSIAEMYPYILNGFVKVVERK